MIICVGLVTDHKPIFNFHYTLHWLNNIVHYLDDFYTPLWNKKGHVVFHMLVSRSICRSSDVRSISFDPYAWNLPNLVWWTPLENSCSLLILGHMVRGQDQTARLYTNTVRPVSFNWGLPGLLQWMSLERRISLLIFRSHGQRSRSNCWSVYEMLSARSLLTPLLESCWTWFSRCLWQVDPYWCLGYMVKVKLLFLVQILSAQCLLSPLVESCQTWFSGCP